MISKTNDDNNIKDGFSKGKRDKKKQEFHVFKKLTLPEHKILCVLMVMTPNHATRNQAKRRENTKHEKMRHAYIYSYADLIFSVLVFGIHCENFPLLPHPQIFVYQIVNESDKSKKSEMVDFQPMSMPRNKHPLCSTYKCF